MHSIAPVFLLLVEMAGIFPALVFLARGIIRFGLGVMVRLGVAVSTMAPVHKQMHQRTCQQDQKWQ